MNWKLITIITVLCAAVLLMGIITAGQSARIAALEDAVKQHEARLNVNAENMQSVTRILDTQTDMLREIKEGTF